MRRRRNFSSVVSCGCGKLFATIWHDLVDLQSEMRLDPPAKIAHCDAAASPAARIILDVLGASLLEGALEQAVALLGCLINGNSVNRALAIDMGAGAQLESLAKGAKDMVGTLMDLTQGQANAQFYRPAYTEAYMRVCESGPTALVLLVFASRNTPTRIASIASTRNARFEKTRVR